MSSPSDTGDAKGASMSSVHTPTSSPAGSPPSISPPSPVEAHDFVGLPQDFDPNQYGGAPLPDHGQGLLNPADAPQESIEEEIARQIAGVEEIGRKPLPNEKKEHIAKTIRVIREGAWLENLKPLLVGKESVPVEYFNRLAAEYEGMIPKVALIYAEADRRVATLQAKIVSLKDKLQEGKSTEDNKDHTDNFKGKDENSDDLRKQIAELEAGEEKCRVEIRSLQIDVRLLKITNKTLEEENTALKNESMILKDENNRLEDENKRLKDENKRLMDENTTLENENTTLENEKKRLKDGAASQGEPVDLRDLRRRTLELKAQLAERDTTIKTLSTVVARANDTVSHTQSRERSQKSNEDLQAHCKELRESRDLYREMWVRRITEGNTPLIQFWDAVENTQKEINQLYHGIERLSDALGLADGVLDTPDVLDKIIAQVTAATHEALDTPQLTILNLRTANALAQIQIETLRRQLEEAEIGGSEDAIRAQLGLVDEEEVEKRVSLRTQAYRQHRRVLFTHIFDAQAELLALAERSVDRDAIEALVDRFLMPTSLPMIQLPTGLARP
ncbi:hypothetical protein F5Y14DRAFT_407858 [Nemania sp. NC0429]|nr:hypothetical protein F5Y14DRAFT_407858 [Nemania sp. NC0429]